MVHPQTECVRFPPRIGSEPYLASRACAFMALPGRRRSRLKARGTSAEISGSAAAAMTGLLVVAVSIRIAYTARSQAGPEPGTERSFLGIFGGYG